VEQFICLCTCMSPNENVFFCFWFLILCGNTVVAVLSFSHSTPISINLSLFLSVLFALIKRIPSSLCGSWKGNYSIYKYPDWTTFEFELPDCLLQPLPSFIYMLCIPLPSVLHLNHLISGVKGALLSLNAILAEYDMQQRLIFLNVNPVKTDLSSNFFTQ